MPTRIPYLDLLARERDPQRTARAQKRIDAVEAHMGIDGQLQALDADAVSRDEICAGHRRRHGVHARSAGRLAGG